MRENINEEGASESDRDGEKGAPPPPPTQQCVRRPGYFY